MSSGLYWEPLHRNKEKLDNNLKFALQKRYGAPLSATLDTTSLDYLNGLRDAGIEDAIKLIEAIELHVVILIKEEF